VQYPAAGVDHVGTFQDAKRRGDLRM
jgi:hypothetical protein